MKYLTKLKTIYLIILLAYFFSGAQSQAVSPTQSPSPTIDKAAQDKLMNQINDLKEKIASKVSQLKLVEKRGILGTIQETTSTQITLVDFSGQTRFVDVDEISKFSSPAAGSSFGISDLKKGNVISVIGLYNKQSRRILGRFITVENLPSFLTGVILEVDKTNSSIKIISENARQTTIEIGKVTKTSSYAKTDGLTRSVFAKISTGERVYSVGFPDKKDSTRLIATRVIIFPDFPKNPKVLIPDAVIKNQDTQITPSTGNGKKLTPIR